MKFRHTNRKGFWIGFIDFFTAGIFLLFYMPLSGLQDEIETVIGHRVLPYWKAYLLGIPTLFIYPLIWMARISEELKEKIVVIDELRTPSPTWESIGFGSPLAVVVLVCSS